MSKCLQSLKKVSTLLNSKASLANVANKVGIYHYSYTGNGTTRTMPQYSPITKEIEIHKDTKLLFLGSLSLGLRPSGSVWGYPVDSMPYFVLWSKGQKTAYIGSSPVYYSELIWTDSYVRISVYYGGNGSTGSIDPMWLFDTPGITYDVISIGTSIS